MKTYKELQEQELFEGNYIVTNYGVPVKISGFKKGDDSDKIGAEITKMLGKDLKKYVMEINIKLKK